jgi:photosystem II stability/assembly factor-like uncharacterized protein
LVHIINNLKTTTMKRKIYLLAISLYFAIAGYCQFVPMPLNYNSPVYYDYPQWMSIVDASTVWLGTRSYNVNGYQVTYKMAVHTNDGGNTWQFDTIPVTGQPVIRSLCALDASTCFYVISNINTTNSAIWKTVDGGDNWVKKTTTEFMGSGGFCDFYHAFDENEGVAMGDPTNGYFEIQRTTDGGDTWTRVDESLIPPPLPGEWGLENAYSALGDNVWFAAVKPSGGVTWSLRVYKSTDRGQHWTVSPTIMDDFGNYKIEFSTAQKGVVVDPYWTTKKKYFYRTSDGGDAWTKDSLSGNDLPIMGVSRVEGFDGGFIMGLADPINITTKLIFTPDFFSTFVAIDSNLNADPYGVQFKDATTGWLCAWGDGADTSAILKYTGDLTLLTSIQKAAKSQGKLVILPNPTSAEALVKLSELNHQGDLSIIIYNAAGTMLENRRVESSTGWTKLNASTFNNGVYVLQIVSGDCMIASAKWVVQH